MMTVQFRSALVSGANRGLGAALVRVLCLSDVETIYAGYRSGAVATSPADRLSAKVVPLRLDVTDSEDILRATETAVGVDLVINNAGVLPFGSALDVTNRALSDALSVNFLRPLAVARAFAPKMAAGGGGTILNILSLLSLRIEPHFAAYCAAKWASWAMTQALRQDLTSTPVRVAAAFPGGIDTEMLRGVTTVKSRPIDVATDIVRQLHEGRLDIFPDPTSKRFVQEEHFR